MKTSGTVFDTRSAGVLSVLRYNSENQEQGDLAANNESWTVANALNAATAGAGSPGFSNTRETRDTG